MPRALGMNAEFRNPCVPVTHPHKRGHSHTTAVEPETGTGSLLHHSSRWHNEGMLEELLMMLLCWRTEGLKAASLLPAFTHFIVLVSLWKGLFLSKSHDITYTCFWLMVVRTSVKISFYTRLTDQLNQLSTTQVSLAFAMLFLTMWWIFFLHITHTSRLKSNGQRHVWGYLLSLCNPPMTVSVKQIRTARLFYCTQTILGRHLDDLGFKL